MIDDQQDAPPAPAIKRGDSDPFVYLSLEPTETEQRLADALDRGSGDHTPFFMLVKVAVRLHRVASWIGRMDGHLRRTRRYVFAAASFAAVNLSGIGIWYIHRVEANATAQEHAAAQERAELEYRSRVDERLQQLQLDIRELRSAIHRLSGIEPGPPNADLQVQPEKLSFTLPMPKGSQ